MLSDHNGGMISASENDVPDSARTADQPRDGHGAMRSSHTAAILEVCGRGVIVLAATLATLHGDGGHWLAWSVMVSMIWLICIQAGFAANATELLALGTPSAAMRGTLLGLASVSAFAYWANGPRFDLGRLLLCGLLVLTLVVAWDTVVRRFASHRRILVVGLGNAGQDIARELQNTPTAPFEVLGFVSDGGSLEADIEAPLVGHIDELSDIVRSLRPEIIVMAVDRNRPAIFGPLLDSADAGFRVVEAAQFCEHAFGRVPVREIQRAWFMSVLHLYQQPYSRLTKRMFDIVVAAIGLLVTLPLLPVLTLLVRLSSGPAILRQVRMGEFGRSFTMYKFRTMRSDAEDPGHAVWAQDSDPRITRVGGFMRRFRLDEIPQLWNVLRGDMSVVGPRPERPEFMLFLEQRVPFWTHRLLVKPGITGWAQVRRGYTSDADGSIDKLSYDLWYLRHRSIFVDTAICLQTLGVLVAGTRETRTGRAVEPAPEAEVLPAWTGNPPKSAAGTNTP